MLVLVAMLTFDICPIFAHVNQRSAASSDDTVKSENPMGTLNLP